jgi:hypothetical protein
MDLLNPGEIVKGPCFPWARSVRPKANWALGSKLNRGGARTGGCQRQWPSLRQTVAQDGGATGQGGGQRRGEPILGLGRGVAHQGWLSAVARGRPKVVPVRSRSSGGGWGLSGWRGVRSWGEARRRGSRVGGRLTRPVHGGAC